MRLHIDRIACDGAGLCAELLPENVALDEWGYPIIVDADVDPSHKRQALKAVNLCPKLALRLSMEGARAGSKVTRLRTAGPATHPGA